MILPPGTTLGHFVAGSTLKDFNLFSLADPFVDPFKSPLPNYYTISLVRPGLIRSHTTSHYFL